MTERDQPHAPRRGGFIEPDPTNTYLISGAFTKSAIRLVLGRAPEGVVLVDLGGKWEHGAKDQLTLVIHPGVAREWAEALRQAADAAENDLLRYQAGLDPKTGGPR